MSVVQTMSRGLSGRQPGGLGLSANIARIVNGSSQGTGGGPPSPSPPCRPAFNVFRAAESGNVDAISSYLNGGGNANKAGKEGYTLIHLAAMRNQERMVELLLARGADPDVHAYGEGLTPLMWASQLGHIGVLVSLLEGGADTEQEDREDLTALHWAARLGQERVLVVLLEHYAFIEAQDYDGNTPLIWAARGGHRACVNRLLDHGADATMVDENGNTALHFACQTGRAMIASDLLDWGALPSAPDYWKFTPIHRACSQGHGNVVMELLKSRAPRHVPSEEGKEMILSEGESSSAFGELVSNSSISRSSSGDSSSWGGSTLWGSKLGGSGTGGAALPPGVIDLRNHFLATPLHRAAAKGHAQVVSILLQNGADVHARDGFFNTPLHLACINGALSCVELLLRAGADPSIKAQGGITPLQAARKPGVREMIQNALLRGIPRSFARVHGAPRFEPSDSLDSRRSMESTTTVESLAERNASELWMADVVPLGDTPASGVARREQLSAAGLAGAKNNAVSIRNASQGVDASVGITQSVTVMDVEDPGWTAPVVIPLSVVTGTRGSIRGVGGQHAKGGAGHSLQELNVPRPRRSSTAGFLGKVFTTKHGAPIKSEMVERLGMVGGGVPVSQRKASTLPEPDSSSTTSKATMDDMEKEDDVSFPCDVSGAAPGVSTADGRSATGTPVQTSVPAAKAPHAGPQAELQQPKFQDTASTPTHPKGYGSPVCTVTPTSTAPPTPAPAPAPPRALIGCEASEVADSGTKVDLRGRKLFPSGTGAVGSESRSGMKRRAKSLPPSWAGDGERARRRREGNAPRPPRPESRPCMEGPSAVIEMLTLDEGTGDRDSPEMDEPSMPDAVAFRRASTIVG